jgi:hypothetical protein
MLPAAPVVPADPVVPAEPVVPPRPVTLPPVPEVFVGPLAGDESEDQPRTEREPATDDRGANGHKRNLRAK